jgi:hypothetical protein
VPTRRKDDRALAELLREREAVVRWLEGPAKKATLAALERQIRARREERAA